MTTSEMNLKMNPESENLAPTENPPFDDVIELYDTCCSLEVKMKTDFHFLDDDIDEVWHVGDHLDGHILVDNLNNAIHRMSVCSDRLYEEMNTLLKIAFQALDYIRALPQEKKLADKIYELDIDSVNKNIEK